MRIRHILVALCLTLVPAAPSFAAVGVSIGISIPAYPRLVAIPGYPVYYAPGVNANYFFYDGMYWVFDGVNWFDSPWYNGPWTLVDPFYVPSFILQVPVRYYHHAPAWFHGWAGNAAPHWHEHWGHDWASRRADWNHYDRRNVPHAAPLPSYQRNYAANRYPSGDQARELHARNYNYQPREQIVQEHYRNYGQQRRAEVHGENPPHGRGPHGGGPPGHDKDR